MSYAPAGVSCQVGGGGRGGRTGGQVATGPGSRGACSRSVFYAVVRTSILTHTQGSPLRLVSEKRYGSYTGDGFKPFPSAPGGKRQTRPFALSSRVTTNSNAFSTGSARHGTEGATSGLLDYQSLPASGSSTASPRRRPSWAGRSPRASGYVPLPDLSKLPVTPAKRAATPSSEIDSYGLQGFETPSHRAPIRRRTSYTGASQDSGYGTQRSVTPSELDDDKMVIEDSENDDAPNDPTRDVTPALGALRLSSQVGQSGSGASTGAATSFVSLPAAEFFHLGVMST